MNVNLSLVESILQSFAALPPEVPVDMDELDAAAMRYLLEHGCLPGEGQPAPLGIPGYPQSMVDATIEALEGIELLETVEILAPNKRTCWRKPGGLTLLGQELLLELKEPETRKKILAAFAAAGDVPYEDLLQVWYAGHRAALRQATASRQTLFAVLLLLVFLLMILSNLLK